MLIADFFLNLRKDRSISFRFTVNELLSELKNSEWINSVKPLAYEILDKLKS